MTYQLDYTFLAIAVQIPLLSTNPREIFFGLPHIANYIMRDAPESLTDQLRARGFCRIAKSRFHGEVCFGKDSEPIAGEFFFITKDGNLTDMRKVINYPNEVVFGSILDVKSSQAVVLSGYVFDESSNRKDVKVYFDPGRKVFVDFADNSHFYSLKDAKMVVPIERLGVYKYELKIVPLLQFDQYKGLDSDFYELEILLMRYPLPGDDIIKNSYLLFKEDPFGFTKISCIGGDVSFPNYLRLLIGDGGSPLFHVGSYGEKGHHDINCSTLKLIIGWMLDLIFLKELPTIQVYQTHEFNFDEWLFVTDYLNISYFHKLFTAIKSKINS